MFKSRKSFALAVLSVLAPMASAAQAQDNGLATALLFGFGATNTPAIRSFVPAPPYFALHPPVYYGQRYTRPYGESPFAAWPQLRSPDNYVPRPAADYANVRPLVINFAPAQPQVAPQVIPAPVYDGVPAPAAPAAPEAPAAPVAPSPVVIRQTTVQPVVVENPYYRPQESRLVGRTLFGR